MLGVPWNKFLRAVARTAVSGSLALAFYAGGADAQSRPLPPLPLTQLDERASPADLDDHSVTLAFAQPVPVGELLLLLVRGSALSIVPDPSATGSFIGDLKSVTIRQALKIVLPPLGLDYSVDGNVIRVFRRPPETRIFDLNYLPTDRVGSSVVGVRGPNSVTVASTTRADLFADLAKGVQTLVSEHAPFNIDRKAGLLQVTDFPDRLDRIAEYLEAVRNRVERQARIDVTVARVDPRDGHARVIDWAALNRRLGAGPRGGGESADTTKGLEALREQGTVTIVASLEVLTLNNEPAVVRTGSMTFMVTPHISNDETLTLTMAPVFTSGKGDPASMNAGADLVARVVHGQTSIIPGLSDQNGELVVLLTPHILASAVSP